MEQSDVREVHHGRSRRVFPARDLNNFHGSASKLQIRYQEVVSKVHKDQTAMIAIRGSRDGTALESSEMPKHQSPHGEATLGNHLTRSRRVKGI